VAPTSGSFTAAARLTAHAGAGPAAGTTVLPEIVSAGPLVLRRTGPRGRAATVHLVGAGAGPLGGDRLDLSVVVGAGARLRLRSVGATLALPSRCGARSFAQVSADVAADGWLDVSLEPLVVAARACHAGRTRLAVADGGGLLWREELVTGRSGEVPGNASTALRVSYAGRPLLAQDLTVGPDEPWWCSSVVLGNAKVVATVLAVGTAMDLLPVPTVLQDPTGVLVTVAQLAGPGRLMTALGPEVGVVRRLVDRLTAAAEQACG
jgi:urease accessory protein